MTSQYDIFTLMNSFFFRLYSHKNSVERAKFGKRAQTQFEWKLAFWASESHCEAHASPFKDSIGFVIVSTSITLNPDHTLHWVYRSGYVVQEVNKSLLTNSHGWSRISFIVIVPQGATNRQNLSERHRKTMTNRGIWNASPPDHLLQWWGPGAGLKAPSDWLTD